jgi:hypothetical protein
MGKSNMVLTLGGIAIAGLRGSKGGPTVAVIVVVCSGKIRVLVPVQKNPIYYLYFLPVQHWQHWLDLKP